LRGFPNSRPVAALGACAPRPHEGLSHILTGEGEHLHALVQAIGHVDELVVRDTGTVDTFEVRRSWPILIARAGARPTRPLGVAAPPAAGGAGGGSVGGLPNPPTSA